MTPKREVRAECKAGEHAYCKPGEVRTSYGDLVLTEHCACYCHRRTPAAPKEPQR
ncbi:hypothetical protein ACFQ69_32855 [Streptomyces sp. NPDC056470]|uniref:hypothetical protein n=1 Tax=Streptomyces sp. NPDC056470 TaxID=3345831 RepID=UPI0036A659B4